MDHFGIGACIRAAIELMLRGMRATGRTTALINSVKDGDRIIFRSRQEAMVVEMLLRRKGLQVSCVVVDPTHVERLLGTQRAAGRTYFDHVWIEEYYTNGIKQLGKDIDHFSSALSGMPDDGDDLKRFRHEEIVRWS